MGDAADEKAARVRSLLSSYYGTDAGEGDEDGVGGRAASIDSAAFDADTYVDGVVKVSCGGWTLPPLPRRLAEAAGRACRGAGA